MSTLPAEADKVAALRLALPAMSAGIYLNAGTCGPLPAETAAAMAELADWELRLGRASPDTYFDVLQRMEEARASIAAIIAADTRDIALTHSASEAMNVAAWGIDWRPGDRAVTARNFEHAGGLSGLYAVRDRLGVSLDLVDLGRGGDHERVLAAFDAAIRPGTRLVSLSHVSHATGAVLPIAEIAEIAHARGALLAVDGAQAVGAIPVDVAALGADLYAIAGQKWLLGPEGTGALVVSPAALERLRMTYASFWSFEEQDMAGSARPWPTARRFEGTSGINHSLVVGLARSCGWLSMYVGLGWALERGAALARQTAERLAALDGVSLVTPLGAMAGLVTFRVAGWPAQAILDELGARAFVIARVIEALDAVRFSVGWFNTQEELDRVLRLVAELAAHTPESMPARRTLTILDGASDAAADPAPVRGRDPLAPVPQPAPADPAGRPELADRGHRPGPRLPRLRRGPQPRRRPARRRPADPGGDPLRGDRPGLGQRSSPTSSSPSRPARAGPVGGAAGAPPWASSRPSPSPTSSWSSRARSCARC